jgi:predicted dehydrogenase
MPSTRRDFLKHAGTVAAAASFTRPVFGDEVKNTTANERFVVGTIGLGVQGLSVTNHMIATGRVDLAWVCDVDQGRLENGARMVEEWSGVAPKTIGDLRKILDQKDVDIVIIATPDHWHAPATILACEAGKHVYVEKPSCHNIREGRVMIETARRTQRTVQVGTQSRSTEHNIKAIKMLHDGAIGDILVAKAWNSQRRADIGRAKPSDPPKQLDYETWLGPAPFTPYQANKLPQSWRWFYDYGTGDIGNDGVHDIDVARWGLGVQTHPNRVSYSGGKLFLGDTDQDWPDTYYVTFDYDLPGGKKKQLIYEQRTWSPYVQEGAENGCAFYGTTGVMIGSKKTGWKIIGAGNIEKEKIPGDGVSIGHHCHNLLDCIRSGKAPNGDIEVGHVSSCLPHLGNIASRTGKGFTFDPKTEQVTDDPAANKFTRGKYRDHWATPKNV